jgi:heptosyltransferase-2
MAVGVRARMSETLIVRLPNWLGDTVMAVPALRGLRRAFPVLRIVAVGAWSDILGGQGLVDAAVRYPRSLLGRIRAADTVRDLHPDTAVLLPNSLESALTARYWGARRRVGFAVGGRAWLLTDRLAFPSPRRHQIDEYLSIVQALGVSTEDREPHLDIQPTDASERAKARELLSRAGALGAARPLVGVHLGAAYGSAKVWPANRVIELCQKVRRAGGTPLLLGAPGDAATATRVETATEAPSLVGRDSPELVAAVLTEIDLLVSGDTGVAHLAAALGTPVIALFGPTDPELSAPRGRAAVVRHAVPCAPCFYRTCPIDHGCMQSIEPDDVMDRARSLLGEGAFR